MLIFFKIMCLKTNTPKDRLEFTNRKNAEEYAKKLGMNEFYITLSVPQSPLEYLEIYLDKGEVFKGTCETYRNRYDY